MKFYILIFSSLLFDGILSEDFRNDMPFGRSIDSDVSYPYENSPRGNNQRLARHVKVVTEGVIDHLFKEMKKRHSHPQKKQSHGRLSKVADAINRKFKALKKKKKPMSKKRSRKHSPPMKDIDSGISRQN